jgi:hypothetical protein
MTEMLAAHVVAHYDKFSQGMATIAVFEGELGVRIPPDKVINLVSLSLPPEVIHEQRPRSHCPGCVI